MTAILFTSSTKIRPSRRRDRAMNGSRDDLIEYLYRKHYARVYRFYTAHRLADDEAHDLAQDVFLRAYQARHLYRAEAEWAFLQKIALRVLLNRVRAQKTKKRNADVVDINDPQVSERLSAPAGPDYAEREEDARRRKRLYQAIAGLPKGQRECVELWLAEREYSEIQTALGITLDAVKSRIRDAKKLLQERLGDDSIVWPATPPEDER
jgi:RNA polymerase sigma factor (sigma-70 family)